jgi:hypothetical protein
MRNRFLRNSWIAVLIGAIACLAGCMRLVGYGDEVASAEIALESAFELAYTPKSSEPHQLWLTYDVEYQGSDFRLQGPFTAQRGTDALGSWTLALGAEGGPIEGTSSRKSIKTVQIASNGQGSMSSTVHIVELPGAPAGEPVMIRGTWTAAPGTTAKALRLVVTD